jgi:hypothetical protein
MRLTRMTTRRWMVAVAVVAIFFGLAERSRRFSEIADLHDGQSEASVTTPEERNRLTRWNAYNRAMCRKYRRAARYPWLPVEPDPPRPR